MNASLETALTAYLPELAGRYAAQILRTFDNAVEKLGPALKNVHNDLAYARVFSATGMCRGCCDRKGNRPTDPVEFNAARVAAKCEKLAAETIAALRVKIEGKLQEIDSGEVLHLSGTGFRITGERAGRKIFIEQNSIVNVSSKGTLFNQFPARIYLDGKFTSEANYKKAF